MTHVSLFNGISTTLYAAELCGWENLAQVEGQKVQLKVPDGLPPMDFYLHESHESMGFDISEFRTGRRVNKCIRLGMTKAALTPEDAIANAEFLLLNQFEVLKRDYYRYETVNFQPEKRS